MELTDKQLTIKQEIEVAELFTSFETRNRYKIYDSKNNAIGIAAEESGFITSNFLKTHRPLKLHIAETDGKDIMLLTRKFFWFVSSYNILDANGTLLGKIKEKWHFFKKEFNLYDAQDNLILNGIAGVPHLWTFRIYSQGQEVARITKNWSGMGKEVFTDADKITLDFGSITDELTKKLLLATVFAFDLTYFESSK